MQTCPACGRESPDGFLHCGYCGASLAAPAVERRKLATLVFCDLSGSTALGERVDAETVRSLMLSYFHEMRGALERHGGTVEKFVGDAVLAVFGVPEAHEDDSLRACRAAVEMQARLAALNEEFVRRFGTRIALRIGVNTGEVVTGDGPSRETFVTGDPVNTAARLEQAAGPGEVLLGESTYRLVRDAVRAEAVEPLNAKGKAEPLAAYRLLEVGGFGPVPRRVGTPFAGREDELDLLERELEAVVAQRECRLVTVVGEPGVGKSRLTAELVSRVGTRARVVRGGCLSYGEGITFWAIGEIVRELAGIHDEHSTAEARALIEARVEGVENGPVVAANLAQLLGLADDGATGPETEWAIRALPDRPGRTQPLVVVVDDIHWADEALLDLLAGLPAAIADTPILLLCLARPELLERRPDWDVTMRLEPLGSRDGDALVQGLLGDAPAVVRERVARASAGNPLFTEELVAMLLDEGVIRLEEGVCTWRATSTRSRCRRACTRCSARASTGSTTTPGPRSSAAPSRARSSTAAPSSSSPLPRRAPPCRRSRAAQGQGHRPSRRGELRRRVRLPLQAHPRPRRRLPGDRQEAPRHTSRAVRDWLERAADDRVTEYEEIIGHHLEQGYRYRGELGLLDDEARALGERAGRRLAAAGQRAHGRGDLGAAANLLGRAAALLPPDSRERIEVVPSLVEALAAFVRLSEAETLIEEASRAAENLGDERLVARLNVERAWLVAHATSERAREAWVLDQAEQAIPVFERLGDESGLARALEVVALVHLYFGRLSAVAEASERGYLHAERAQDAQEQGKHRLGRMVADQWGSTPLDRVDELLEDDLAWAQRTGSLAVEAKAMVRLGVVRALLGDRVGGNELFDRGMTACTDLGARIWAYQELGCWIWALTDDPAVAEPRLRETCGVLEEAGRLGVLSTVATILAECLYRQGRFDEAGAMLDAADEHGADDDLYTQVRLRAGRATLLAQGTWRRRKQRRGGRGSRPRGGGSRRRDGVRRPARRLAARARRGASPGRPRCRGGRGDAGGTRALGGEEEPHLRRADTNAARG